MTRSFGVHGAISIYRRAARRTALADLPQASLETLDVLRIEAGVPKFLVDMTEDTIPLEAGIEDRAISFTKGCYVGQEVIVRVTHRGGGRVAKRLVQWKDSSHTRDRRREDRLRRAGHRPGDERGILTGAERARRSGLRASRFRECWDVAGACRQRRTARQRHTHHSTTRIDTA